VAESGADDDFGAEAPEPMPDSMPESTPESMSEPEPQAAPAEAELPPPEADAHDEDVELADAPSLVPPIEQDALADDRNAALDSEDVESYAARRQRMRARRKQSRRSSRWTAIVLVLFAVNVALVGARDEVVRYLPQTASVFAAIGLPVNLRHLTFENVKISKDAQNGVNVLIVEGTIVSTAKNPITVPRLRFAARDAVGQEIYTWTALPSRSVLGPGEKLEFRSRLASPPADARNVMVRFFNSKDAAGAK